MGTGADWGCQGEFDDMIEAREATMISKDDYNMAVSILACLVETGPVHAEDCPTIGGAGRKCQFCLDWESASEFVKTHDVV